MTTAPVMGMTAVMSDDGRYRYRLTRRWDDLLQDADSDGLLATFVMLNPSTADERRNDPTIVRCIAFARTWGCVGLEVVNLYAYRSTHPVQLWQVRDPVGKDNDRYLAAAATQAGLRGAPLVAAWGAHARPDRVAQVLALPGMGRLTCLGVTNGGAPRHPLYVRTGTAPTPWPADTDPRED